MPVHEEGCVQVTCLSSGWRLAVMALCYRPCVLSAVEFGDLLETGVGLMQPRSASLMGLEAV